MTSRFRKMVWICCALLSGCDTLLPHTYKAVDDSIFLNQCCCCNEDYYQNSGYYYNGYQENGWRYCVEKFCRKNRDYSGYLQCR